MTDDEILALALDHDAIQGGQHFSAAIAFARAIIAQARAEWAAELVPVAWANPEGTEIAMAHDKWRRPTAVIPLAIIPSIKEGS